MQEENITKRIFSERLNEAMGRNSLSQKQITMISGISQSAISQYMSGKREPKSAELFRLARCLGVSMEWLLGGEDFVASSNSIPSDYELLKKENLLLRSRLEMAITTLRGSLCFLESEIK